MLSQDLTRYVDLHRSLGFRFRTQHSLLRNFVTYADAQRDEFVRVDRARASAIAAPAPQPPPHGPALCPGNAGRG